MSFFFFAGRLESVWCASAHLKQCMECVSWGGGVDRAARVCVRRSGVTVGQIAQQARTRPVAVGLIFILNKHWIIVICRQFLKIQYILSQSASTVLIPRCRVFQIKTKSGRWCVQTGGTTTLGSKHVSRSDIPGEKMFHFLLCVGTFAHLETGRQLWLAWHLLGVLDVKNL